MGPKKEEKRKENEPVRLSIDDPVNTDVWRCVVMMAVERTSQDGFLLREFMEGAASNRRRVIKLINYESFVLKILDDFANGELAYKYSFLLQFSTIFQEAAEYVKNKTEIPVELLVKVVKALLLYLRNESMKLINMKPSDFQDPIKAMMERPANVNGSISKGGKPGLPKKDLSVVAKGKVNGGQDVTVRVRPPSNSKEDTKLVRRGEGAKEANCIDDAPIDGFFNVYILLTGFYNPEFPLELIKAHVPLHALLCIDTSTSNIKRSSSTYNRIQKKNFHSKSTDIQLFWTEFLKILWNQQLSYNFRDVIFQVYSPQNLNCEKKKLQEFVYKEISYLMYDLSDYKRQHLNYLKHLKLWDVEEALNADEIENLEFQLDEQPNECVTVPLILQAMLDIICGVDKNLRKTVSFDSIISDSENQSIENIFSDSMVSKRNSSTLAPAWSQRICNALNLNTLKIYSKTKELDYAYHLREQYIFESFSQSSLAKSFRCPKKRRNGPTSGNIEEALDSENGIFGSYWRACQKNGILKRSSFGPSLDYVLYILLASKMVCPYLATDSQDDFSSRKLSSKPSVDLSSSKQMSSLEIIDNIQDEMRKPHFTVTECSRSVSRSIPYNMKSINRNVFCTRELKIVSPDKVKFSSAPEFHVLPCLVNEMSFFSDLIPPNYHLIDNIECNVFKDLGQFMGNSSFLNLTGFNYVEELSKSTLLTREEDFWQEYNCIDYSYSPLTDSIFVVLHNRKNDRDSYHEAFNSSLKTNVGLRDFFEYVLEDETSWFSVQEELHKKRDSIVVKKPSLNYSYNPYNDCDFWLESSIKYQDYLKISRSEGKEIEGCHGAQNNSNKVKAEANSVSTENEAKNVFGSTDEDPGSRLCHFEGYNVDDLAVQFSGIKSVYYGRDSRMTVELIERLYGNQDLGIHISQGGHSLHLYSYVCPEPHVLEPYTCHLTYKNGIVLAFGKRFVQEIETENVEETVEVTDSKKVLSKTKRSSSGMATLKKISVKKIINVVEDKEFAYDLKLSLPNGLYIEIVRKTIRPCHVKQHFLNKTELQSKTISEEKSRLFLPNGNLVKIMNDGNVQILNVNTRIVNSSLRDLTEEVTSKGSDGTGQDSTASGPLAFATYEMTTSCGRMFRVDGRHVTSSKRIHVFTNTDVESNRIFYKRLDGTNYVLSGDGSLCTQFRDGTKIGSKPYVVWCEQGEQNATLPEFDDFLSEFVFVHEEITFEHPSYATVIYNSLSEQWKIRLPYESEITVTNEGSYFINIDRQTKMNINRETINMTRMSSESELLCEVTANLTVFHTKSTDAIYCEMRNSTGETYVVEANALSYVLPNDRIHPAECECNIHVSSSAHQQDNGSGDRKRKMNTQTNALSLDSKYFVVRKDISGFQILNNDDVKNSFSSMPEGSLVFTQEFPGVEKLRCFVLMTPAKKNTLCGSKWDMVSTLPDTSFHVDERKDTSSTYGLPPSWMHPFPKRKYKLHVPERLTCRVFIETCKTNFTPKIGQLECCFCEIPDLDEGQQSLNLDGPSEDIQHYIRRICENDQALLKKMYLATAKKIINEKKNLKPVNTAKLDHYLAMSKYQVELQEYHKHSIRYQLVPNYFHYPTGMSWLVLDDLIGKFKCIQADSQKQTSVNVHPVHSLDSFRSDAFSNEELEYDLSSNSCRSYSDLSYRTNVSSKTAPLPLSNTICPLTCEKPRTALSAPIYKFQDKICSQEDLEVPQSANCSINDDDLNILREALCRDDDNRGEHVPPTSSSYTLEDLVCLGLI